MITDGLTKGKPSRDDMKQVLNSGYLQIVHEKAVFKSRHKARC